MSMSTVDSSKPTVRRALFGLLTMLAVLFLWVSPAAAHVDFLGSTPSNVSTVPGPVSEVILEFSGEADPITDDFRIENSAGDDIPIRSVANDGDNKLVVSTADPINVGRTKVLWALRGADGHKMSGSIVFTVTQAPAAAVPAPETSGTPNVTTPTSNTATETSSDGSAQASLNPVATITSSDSGLAETAGVVARWCVYGAILLTVGALAYLLWVHRGTRSESRRIVFFIRRAAVLVVLGSVIEWFAQLALWDGGGIGDLLRPAVWGELGATGFGLGTLCRIVGAVLVLRFVAIDVVAEDAVDDARVVDLDWITEPDISGSVKLDHQPRSTTLTRVRVESGPLALLGAAILILSESFIGHTASIEPRVLMALSDAVHLTAASIWAAGAWLLAATLWRRNRRNEPLNAELLATRFSLLATWSLVAVAVSGTVLAWAILDQPSALWASEFGRLLLGKVVVVIVIGSIGLHNQRTLLPALVTGDESSAQRFRTTIAIESLLFVVVLLITSLLVIASPLS
jgi:copper transport protein